MAKKVSKLNPLQIGVLLLTVVIFLFLYFGFDTVPSEQKALEKSRAVSMESTGIQNLLRDARRELNIEKMSVIDALLTDYDEIDEDSAKIELLEQISGLWYQNGYATISGYYAEEIAKIRNDELSWSIAGTTYALGAKTASEQKVKDFSTSRAIKAFENAISIAPENIDTKINMAMCYIDNPPSNNPMQGILMLRDLNEAHPENVKVLNQLGRLGLETNQTERALSRLEKALSLEPENNKTICLLARAYTMAGNVEQAKIFENKCLRN